MIGKTARAAFGRPALDAQEKLGDYIGVAVTPAMRAALQMRARRAGYRSLSSFIRQTLFAPALSGCGKDDGEGSAAP